MTDLKNWKDTIVRPEGNIRDALRALDAGAQKIALVCDNSDKLIGLISDGDIRRGLLSDLQMDDPVTEVTNINPRFEKIGITRKEIREILINEDIGVLPVVDGKNRVIELHSLSSISERPKLDNPVFIMAGGFGTRLKPLTDNCPKPMLPIGNKPMLQHTIERLKRQGFHNFFISLHYLPEKIKEYFGDGDSMGVKISYVYEDAPLGTGGAIGLLPSDMVSKPLVLLNGDVLTDLDFADILDAHERNKADATMCLREQETSLAYGVVEVIAGSVTNMTEKPTYRHLINTGIYVLSTAFVKSVRKHVRIDLPSLLEQRIQDGHLVSAYTFYGKWLDIGQMNDYLSAQATFRSSLYD